MSAQLQLSLQDWLPAYFKPNNCAVKLIIYFQSAFDPKCYLCRVSEWILLVFCIWNKYLPVVTCRCVPYRMAASANLSQTSGIAFKKCLSKLYIDRKHYRWEYPWYRTSQNGVKANEGFRFRKVALKRHSEFQKFIWIISVSWLFNGLFTFLNRRTFQT